MGTCAGGGEVQIAPPSVTVRVGERQSVFATAYDSRGNVIPGVPLRWSSTNLAVLRVVPDSTAPDLATLVGIAPGVAQVEVRAADRKGSATVQVAAAGAGAPPVRMPVARGGAASHLQIDPNTVYLLPAEGRRLNPIFLMADGTPASPAPVTWRSMIPSVASVNAQGVVVGLGAGQGLIEASAPGGLSARVPVQVALSRFTLDQSAVAMSPGTFDSLHVVVPERNNRRVAPEALQWRTTDPGVVRVSPLGVVSAGAGGTAEIVASGFLQEARVAVTVHRPVEFMQFSPPVGTDTVQIPLGGTQHFLAEALAADNSPVPNAPIRFDLEDTSVVSFVPTTGIATAKALGVTKLRVSGPGAGLDTMWTVSVVGGSTNLTASFTDAAGEPIAPATQVRWTTLDPSVARVDADGGVLGAGYGSASVVATTPWGSADTTRVYVQGEIVVTSLRSGAPDLYAFDRSAPGLLNPVTSSPQSEMSAAYSPDGSRIAYVSAAADGNQEIFLVNADGTDPLALTVTAAGEDSPDWSADGREIVYASNATGSFQIWIMDADGSNPRRLTEGPDFNFQPAVSPDGETIAFTSTRAGNYEIFMMDLDGSNQRNASNSTGKETSPVWFPDGQIAFIREVGTGKEATSAIVKADAGTGPLAILTPPGLNVTDFALSRDGTLLVMTVAVPGSGRSINSRLYLIELGSAPAVPVEVPVSSPEDQFFAPAFKR